MDPKDVRMDAFYRGQAFGDVAHVLAANGMNPNALRRMGANATLRKDEWKTLDESVVAISESRLVGVQDLISRSLVYRLPNGMGTTVLEYETQSDLNAAMMSIDGEAEGGNDALNYEIGYLPLPITSKEFKISSRKLESSRKLGQPLDVSQAQVCARKVAEKIETTLFTGAGTFTFGGGTLYGYTDHPSRNLVSFASSGEYWDDVDVTGSAILSQVVEMKQASINDKHYGPWILYVPTNYETKLDEDFKTNSDLTIRARLKQIDGIQDVKVADSLTADNVVLVEMQPDTARVVIGLEPRTIEWQARGGMSLHFLVLAIMVPQIRADQDGNCGIVHLS